MNTAATISSFTVAPNSNTVGQSTSYTFQISHIIPHAINDYAIISIPSLMSLPSSPSCSALSGIISIGCALFSSTELKIVYSSVPTNNNIQVRLSSLINYLVGDQAVSFGVKVYDSGDFKMQQFLNSPVTYTQSTITTVNVNNDKNIALGQLSNITLTITNSISLYSSLTTNLTQLDIKIPPQFTIGTSCVSTAGTCTVFSSSVYRIFGVGLSLSLMNVTMPNVLLSFYNPTSTSFGLVYTYNGFNVSVKTSGINVGIYCTSPCKRCSASPTTCQSCMPAPNILILHDPIVKTCAATCVSGKYPDSNNECQPCVSPCSTCLDASNCSSCVANMWLYQVNSTCMAVCPSTYYNNSNGLCSACQSPCSNCLSLTSCLNCAVGYYSNNWCVNASNCPSGTYANSTTMACQTCQLPCTTCSSSATNCTSCQTGFLYYSNLCVNSCPSGMYQSTIYCFNCTGSCSTCTSSSFCTSCATLFLNSVAGTCVNASNCPSGTYGNTTSMSCVSCQLPCSTCSQSAANCTACQNGYLYYNNLCVANCPSGMYQSTIFCFNCVGACSTCTSSLFCTSCTTLYLNSVSGTCVNATNCPSGTYGNSTSMSCANCQLPCTTCSQSATNCTACQSGYLYYNNLCVTNCPSGMFQSSSNCFNCVGPCSTCNSVSFCTSCATDYLNSVTGQCVDASNCPGGTYANDTLQQCRTCPTGCTGCTNSTNCTSCNNPLYLFYNYGCFTLCPAGTYQSGVTCLLCSPPCQTCRNTDTNCTSCLSPLLYFNNGCRNTCPSGTYNNNGTCTTCKSSCLSCSSGTTCDTCPSPLYFELSQCVLQCSTGSYGNSITSICVICAPPCSQCYGTDTNCTKCISPQLQYQNGCVNSCPSTYFAYFGSCITCPNCVNCLDATTCLQCKPGYYGYNGVCYTSCPSSAPISDDTTYTCGKCDQSCLTCQNIAKNCTSCFSSTFLYKGTCLTSCPLGFIQQLVSGTCKQPLIGNIIYFPFSFFFLFFCLIFVASKCLYPSTTQSITGLGAISSLSQFASWCLLSYIVTVDYSLDDQIINIAKYVGLACVVLSIGLGVSFIIATYKQYQWDKGLLAWKEYENVSLYTYRVINVMSVVTFRFFRFLYCRFFNRTFFSMYIADGQRLLTNSSRLTFISLITNTLPMLGICAILLYKKQLYDQTFFSALDTMMLGFISAVLLTIDSCKSKDHFQSIKSSLPFLKYKNMGNQESMIGQTLLSRAGQQNKQKPKSQIDNDEQRQKIFKKINWLSNKNKFGHLNVIQAQKQKQDGDDTKSLPDYNKLDKYQQYDPNNINNLNDDDDHVINDDLYFTQTQSVKLKREQEQEERLRIQQQQKLKKEQQQNKKRQIQRKKQEQQRRLKQQELRRKRELMEEDQRERVDLEFPDLAAIDKVENKNGKNRKNPLDLLSNCKKTDEKPVDDKALKKLQQIGKKNGIDPAFMKQTFGVQKNHNAQLLNQIIDKHNHVKRQSVKQLFSQQNNPQILQQLFGKNSKMDPKKLRQLLNDPQSAKLIQKLASKQHGIISAEIAKQLFQQNSKYTKQFTKNLLNDDNGMDSQKLKVLLKQNNGKGKDSALKALKKIGGQNLQNTNLLNNMMGSDAVLKPQQFTRVANDLSIKAIENIFKNKSKNSDIIASKLLNNKKINLKNLAPILQDQELLQQLAQALGSDDPNLEQNLLNLFKNAQNIDPTKLKQMLADPIIRQKLLTKPVDPQFLSAILSKDSKSDLKILSNALKQMPDDLIYQTFKFDPEKNTDFKNLAALFDANPKTDPQLVAKMLQPDMVKRLYVKGNDTKMLNKLVEKGNQFDPEVIKNVYGDQRTNIFDMKTDNNNNNNNGIGGGYGNNTNFLNFDDDKVDEIVSQKQYSLGFQKNNNFKNQNQANMSRTAGGVLSFLTPIVPVNNNIKNNPFNRKDMNETNQWSSNEQNQQQDIQDGQIIQQDQFQQNGQGKKRKKKGKKTKKKLVDIRHPAQQVYLQRIEAPHQVATRKASIRKKKKKVAVPGVMDQDNDIFDMDF